ncbi:hypothetical protein LptCag_2318 [Leptospirillum ferriphilum]|uniref:Uncharacterized protein n=1 Tax=Leptospirillum ferriphilum TaxID=178606 RepID=A0A094X8L3_9BACT|nr:hypothetical protein LptCag_2318 [Leptospirillum ferriphilum]
MPAPTNILLRFLETSFVQFNTGSLPRHPPSPKTAGIFQ